MDKVVGSQAIRAPSMKIVAFSLTLDVVGVLRGGKWEISGDSNREKCLSISIPRKNTQNEQLGSDKRSQGIFVKRKGFRPIFTSLIYRYVIFFRHNKL